MLVNFGQTSNNYSINSENGNKIENVQFKPRISGTEINITTPINKTYYQPMSGYYPATYGFENDVVGSIPLGWVNYSGDDTNCFVTNGYNGHSRVIQMEDD